MAENKCLIDVDRNYVAIHHYSTRCGIFLTFLDYVLNFVIIL